MIIKKLEVTVQPFQKDTLEIKLKVEGRFVTEKRHIVVGFEQVIATDHFDTLFDVILEKAKNQIKHFVSKYKEKVKI